MPKTTKQYKEELEAYFTKPVKTIKVSQMIMDTITKVAEYFDGDINQALMYIMLIFSGQEDDNEI